MPAITEYAPPGTPERTLASGLEGDNALRGRWYDQVRKYYDGEMERFLDVKEGEPDDNVIINKVRQVVDRTVAFLFPSMPELELDPDISGQTEDEKWLEDLWNENGGIALIHDLALVGAMSGHVYVRVMPADASQGQEFPQLLMLDPKAVQTYWAADNVKRVMFHELRWSVQTPTHTQDYLIDFINEGTKWRIIQYENGLGVANWKETDNVEWNSVLPPVIHWKHLPNPRNFYGTSEFTKAQLELNDKINLTTSESNRIIRYHASPKTVATGTSAEDIQETAIDEMWAVDSPDAKLYNLEMQSDLGNSINQSKGLSDEFLSESRVVILQGTVKDFQRVTNAGVRTVFIDMLSKNTILRWNYGKAIQMISRVAAFVGGKGKDIIPVVNFIDPLPTDQTETANVAALERQMKLVSRQTLSVKRGYDWQSEKAKMGLEENDPLFAVPEPGNGQTPKSPPTDAASRLKHEAGSTSNS